MTNFIFNSTQRTIFFTNGILTMKSVESMEYVNNAYLFKKYWSEMIIELILIKKWKQSLSIDDLVWKKSETKETCV